jgi:hypothetical protein
MMLTLASFSSSPPTARSFVQFQIGAATLKSFFKANKVASDSTIAASNDSDSPSIALFLQVSIGAAFDASGSS